MPTGLRAQSAACVHAQSCPTPGDSMGCSLPGSSGHGILQARILEWVAVSSSKVSSCPRDRTCVSSITDRLLTSESLGKSEGYRSRPPRPPPAAWRRPSRFADIQLAGEDSHFPRPHQLHPRPLNSCFLHTLSSPGPAQPTSSTHPSLTDLRVSCLQPLRGKPHIFCYCLPTQRPQAEQECGLSLDHSLRFKPGLSQALPAGQPTRGRDTDVRRAARPNETSKSTISQHSMPPRPRRTTAIPQKWKRAQGRESPLSPCLTPLPLSLVELCFF